MKTIKVLALEEGAMFCVPLVQASGFGFGYVALSRKGWGYLLNIFDHVAADDTPPDAIESKPLAVRHLLGNDGLFAEAKDNPDPWRVLGRKVQAAIPVERALFQIGSKIVDMVSGAEVGDPSIDRKSLPYKEYPLDNEYSFLVAARLLRCGFAFNEAAERYELVRQAT
ncbi:hypothetical protein [Phreatobacter sp. AB_2022a]|uniref:hypothetical protein n=1 Tax=Phreatobacter sp. AB_2022a TaxID=3003134 RepID=UPI002286DA95|nr:hypothetical protein [Phreatobacter sp. AB_2022a]MCZ0737294.1 hypothetical protein [Phreatobacter sp. AB_2022a]